MLLIDIWQKAYAESDNSDERYEELRTLLLDYLKGISKKTPRTDQVLTDIVRLECPFCGEQDQKKITVENMTMILESLGKKQTCEYVYCWNCGAAAEKKFWNMRTA